MTALALFARFWRETLIAALLLAVAALIGYSARKADQLRVCEQSRLTDQATWRAASEKARADDLAKVVATKNAQEAITDKVVHEYETRIADTDARYERLRRQADSYRGSQPSADLSAASEATCQAYAATNCDAIPAKLKAAQDNTDQLLSLQDWAAGQSAIPVNPFALSDGASAPAP